MHSAYEFFRSLFSPAHAGLKTGVAVQFDVDAVICRHMAR